MLEMTKGNPINGNWYVLLAGLPPPERSIPLAPGLSLRPMSEPLSIFDLAAVGSVGFKEWATLEPICSHCTAEIESARDADTHPGYDTLNRAWLLTALLVLRGFTGLWGVACSGYSWNRIAGHQKRTSQVFGQQLEEEGLENAVFRSKRSLPPFRGNLLDYHLKCFTVRNSRNDPINDADALWIEQNFDRVNQLAAESEKFRLALESAIDWRFAKEPRSAVARLWVGIEALFGIKAEQVYRIAAYSASLLSGRGAERVAIFSRVKKLYNTRSKIVHGESLPDEQISDAMSDSFYLLKDLLVLLISRGNLLGQDDFDNAVFG